MEREAGAPTAEDQELINASAQKVVINGLAEADQKTPEQAKKLLEERAERLRDIEARMRSMVNGVMSESLAQIEGKAETVDKAAEDIGGLKDIRLGNLDPKTGGLANPEQGGDALIDARKTVRADGSIDTVTAKGIVDHEHVHMDEHGKYGELNDTEIGVLNNVDIGGDFTLRDFREARADRVMEQKSPGSIEFVAKEQRATDAKIYRLFNDEQIKRIAADPYALAV